jgi:hypothetical protein
MTDNEFAKAIDLCEKLDFFGGQRAGRELWFEKPVDVQDRDIKQFVEDVAFLKDFINRQKAEIERLIDLASELTEDNEAWLADNIDLRVKLKTAKAEAIKEFAERLKKNARKFTEYDEGGWGCTVYAVKVDDIDNTVEEMTEEQK